MPSVRQSSRMVWSKVPGRTAALKSATVFSSAAGSSSSFAGELGDRVAPAIGGNSVGMKLVTTLESKMM